MPLFSVTLEERTLASRVTIGGGIGLRCIQRRNSGTLGEHLPRLVRIGELPEGDPVRREYESDCGCTNFRPTESLVV